MTEPTLHRKKHSPPSTAGVFVYCVGAACLALGFVMATGLDNLRQNIPSTTTYWQEKAVSFEVEKPVRVVYTSPEALALKAEMDTLRASFGQYARTQQQVKREIYGSRPAVAKISDVRPVQTTSQLAGKIIQTLLLDEADSFFQKVRIVEDVRSHVSGRVGY